jgi:hypothetical protein
LSFHLLTIGKSASIVHSPLCQSLTATLNSFSGGLITTAGADEVFGAVDSDVLSTLALNSETGSDGLKSDLHSLSQSGIFSVRLDDAPHIPQSLSVVIPAQGGRSSVSDYYQLPPPRE